MYVHNYVFKYLLGETRLKLFVRENILFTEIQNKRIKARMYDTDIVFEISIS